MQGSRTRNINGQVVLQGVSIGNVRVTYESATRSFVRTVFADGSGNYFINGVPVGDYTITLEAEGFQTARQQETIYPGTGILILQHFMRPMPGAAAHPASKQGSVDVTDLKIPADARDELAAGKRDAERRRYKTAREHFEKALDKYAAFPEALCRLASLDLIDQQPNTALGRLRRAVEIKPAYAFAQFMLSRLLNRLGDHAQALEAARQAVALKPENWEAHYELGLAALSLGQTDLAVESASRIEKLAGTRNADCLLLRAGAELRMGRYEEAKADLDAFLKLAPDHTMADLARRALQDVGGRMGVPRSN